MRRVTRRTVLAAAPPHWRLAARCWRRGRPELRRITAPGSLTQKSTSATPAPIAAAVERQPAPRSTAFHF
jgi:hypothetical protein